MWGQMLLTGKSSLLEGRETIQSMQVAVKPNVSTPWDESAMKSSLLVSMNYKSPASTLNF